MTTRTTATEHGSRTRHEIKARRIPLTFGADIPRHWFFESALPTHVVNGLNLLFPLGERFFVRAVRKYLDRIDDPALLAQVKGFVAQEVRHGIEHERFFAVLEAQGYDVKSFLATYERIAFRGIERISPDILGLSVTVALEHFTATFAHRALEEDFLDHAHPVLRELLRWHSCEEIEHKSVAFDVLRAVDDRYFVRVAGLVVATATLVPFWIAATAHLLAQDGLTFRSARKKLVTKAAKRMLAPRTIVEAIRGYLRRDFHPSQVDDFALAKTWLAARGYDA